MTSQRGFTSLLPTAFALRHQHLVVQRSSRSHMQAALENVPLSDLEKRMMYLTETDECPEDPIALNDAFEAEYDTGEYEEKVSRLLRRAYARLNKENSSAARTWDEAVQELRKGDHYLLVFLADAPIGYALNQSLFGWSFRKLLGIGILILGSHWLLPSGNLIGSVNTTALGRSNPR